MKKIIGLIALLAIVGTQGACSKKKSNNDEQARLAALYGAHASTVPVLAN